MICGKTRPISIGYRISGFRPHSPKVGSSNLPPATKQFKGLQHRLCRFFWGGSATITLPLNPEETKSSDCLTAPKLRLFQDPLLDPCGKGYSRPKPSRRCGRKRGRCLTIPRRFLSVVSFCECPVTLPLKFLLNGIPPGLDIVRSISPCRHAPFEYFLRQRKTIPFSKFSLGFC